MSETHDFGDRKMRPMTKAAAIARITEATGMVTVAVAAGATIAAVIFGSSLPGWAVTGAFAFAAGVWTAGVMARLTGGPR